MIKLESIHSDWSSWQQLRGKLPESTGKWKYINTEEMKKKKHDEDEEEYRKDIVITKNHVTKEH
jgi:hypothetical protein